jgi:hypothetical protein
MNPTLFQFVCTVLSYQSSSKSKTKKRSGNRNAFRGARGFLLATLFTVVLAVGLGASIEASSAELSAVTLLYFRGIGQDNAILLEWATGTEFNTAGFRLTRASDETGQYQSLDHIGFIPAEGDGLVGAVYEAVDTDNVINGTIYWYELIEMELDGNENLAGPISVTAGIATPTATNTPAPTPTETEPGSTQSITATPENTPGEFTPTATLIIQGSPQATDSSATNSPLSGTPIPAGTTQPLLSTPAADPSPGNSNPTDATGAVDPQVTLDVSGYPGPLRPTAVVSSRDLRSIGDAGYPSPDDASPTAAPASYPLGLGERLPNLTPPADSEPSKASAVIGNQDNRPIGGTDGQTETTRSGGSTLMLWVGFIAALLVFSAGVIGSVVYFSRQRMQGR